MSPRVWVLALVLALSALLASLSATPLRMYLVKLRGLDLPVRGKVIDLTANHGEDNRIWSPTLGCKRDLYVYLPPGYCACKRYPIILWLHTMADDERQFIDDLLLPLDRAIAEGVIPPVIVVAPDGSITGTPRVVGSGSFYLNSPRAGRFEDYLIRDVWEFALTHFSIRPEAGAHAIVGVSMGGFAAFNKVLKYPEAFGVAVGIVPPLHLRYADCRGRTMANFDPACTSIRTNFSDPSTIIGRFAHLLKVRQPFLIDPLYDAQDPTTPARVASENPYELLDPVRHGGGRVALYVGYGSRDQFNLDAHAEALLHRARELGIPITSERLQCGDHFRASANKLLQGALPWLGKQLAPYGPTP